MCQHTMLKYILYGGEGMFYMYRDFLGLLESSYDDSVIYSSYNEKGELLTVDEVCSGIVEYPDSDVEFLKQMYFDFLTPWIK